MVIDRHWKVILANRACSVLFGRQVVGGKFLRDSLANPAAAQVIVNWPRSHEQDWTGSATTSTAGQRGDSRQPHSGAPPRRRYAGTVHSQSG
jgi:hypothetical protein